MAEQKLNKVHMDVLHFEHERWVNQLKFYKDELLTYNNRLEEIVNRYTNNEVLAELEKYQNKFIRQNEVIDVLMHDINNHESILTDNVVDNPVASDRRLFDDHDGIRNRMDDFLKIYNELKSNFNRFLVKYM